MPRVITINIVNFDNIKIERYHRAFHIYEDRQKDYLLTDALEIHFLNMVKFRRLKSRDKSDALYRWLAYFDVHTSLEELEVVIKMDPGISKA